MGDRIAVLLGGEIAQDAAPATVLARPASLEVARFLGIPNIVVGEHDGRGAFHSILGCHAAVGPAGRVAAVFRPDVLTARQATGPGAVGRVLSIVYRVSGSLVRIEMGGQEFLALPAGERELRAGDMVELQVAAPGLHLVPVVDATFPQQRPDV